ncbi:methionyl-tRNA formyltransferase [Methyloferula stellata]|uniref:methionyl-tRNA formyltransferase n=1 Tax=Methyloferula stellata TaxID=876270 RepID=UPI0003761E3D|nr:methionyl-tRNA formyltransferase [Methyloferula stellata]
MRIIFMGTPDFSVPVLAAILAAGHEVVAVYTRAPKPGGRRGLDLTPSPVQVCAEKHGLKVFSPKTLRTDEEAAAFREHAADVAVVVAYGLILPKAILDAPAKGCLNLHGSLLPRWRGAAPIQRAIMAGDSETGVMVMRMEEGLDTGPVGMTARIPIAPDMTAGELHDQLSPLGAELMVRALSALADGKLTFTPQAEEGVTYAHKIDKAEARIDWAKPAYEVHNIIRGLSPFPGAFFEADFGKGIERVKVLRSTLAEGHGTPGTALDDALTIACGEGAVRLIEVQRSGKAPMLAEDFLRGTKVSAGTAFK